MNEFALLIQSYIQDKQTKKGLALCPSTWLDDAAKRISQIALATHVLKYTHSDAKGTNILVRQKNKTNKYARKYVTTDSLSNLSIDVVGNAAAMDIAGLFDLRVDGVGLLEFIVKNDCSMFAPFATSQEQLDNWMVKFKSILSEPSHLSSHTLAKQIYFPIDDGYHLLGPLYSSSLAQSLYEDIQKCKFSLEAQETRQRKREEKSSVNNVVDYPDLAIMMYGGTKPQNISKLNSRRMGKSYLLKSVPPEWKTIRKPPMKKHEFWTTFSKVIAPILKEFRQYLHAIDALDSNKHIRHKVHNFTNSLIDQLLITAATFQAMTSGWSLESEIPLEEKLWLDPLHDHIKDNLDKTNWMEIIAESFATFILRKLKDKELKLRDCDHNFFVDQCLDALKEINV